MIITLTIIAILALAVMLFLQHPKFGNAPRGNRLELIKKSPNFKDGSFQNIEYTPFISEGFTYLQVVIDFFFTSYPRTAPKNTIPSVKTDILNLNINEDLLIWFGHSSYFFQLDGKRFLVDPVFSGNASPVPASTTSFKGTDVYTVDDLPEIDYLLISHDHYDHLDYETIIKLKPKVKQIICGLGVASHFELWGFANDIIFEKDWNETISLGEKMIIYTTTARHFSGRSFSRNNTLWMSYILQSGDYKIFIGGDSGYGKHFKEIGEKFGGFDLAILENGQYNLAWHEIHMMPNEVLLAAKDLKTKRLFAVHHSKFKLALHAWDEPIKQIYEINKQENIPMITPKIGEIVYLKDMNQSFEKWWKGVE